MSRLADVTCTGTLTAAYASMQTVQTLLYFGCQSLSGCWPIDSISTLEFVPIDILYIVNSQHSIYFSPGYFVRSDGLYFAHLKSLADNSPTWPFFFCQARPSVPCRAKNTDASEALMYPRLQRWSGAERRQAPATVMNQATGGN